MTRTANPANYVVGKPCRNCGGTLRFRGPQHQCVECERVRRERRRNHTSSHRAIIAFGEQEERKPQGESLTREQMARKLGYFQSAYQTSGGAIERSKYLNELVRKKMKVEEVEAMPTICGGDLHRAALKVGAQTSNPSHNKTRVGSPLVAPHGHNAIKHKYH